MPGRRAIWVLDTSILVSYFQSGKYGEFIKTGFRTGNLFLPGVVLCELYAGAVSKADRADLEKLRAALGPHLVSAPLQDWVLAGRCLALYSAQSGKIRPRDHLADILIAVRAAKLKATLASENIKHMSQWARVLDKFGYKLKIGRVPE